MPFREVSRMEAKLEFVRLASAEGANVRALCRGFGVSATTAYKWLARYREAGAAGLADLSRRPRHSPRRSTARIETSILEMRAEHPVWGARKLRKALENKGLRDLPAPSTITEILRRNGVSLGDFGGGAKTWTRFEHPEPNDLWQMDFKGHVGLAGGRRLHPLTVLDDHSRYSIAIAACENERTATVRDALVAAFRRYGLPRWMITDNGAPWGNGPGSPFTPLGVFLIDQGIRISHSRPYHPQTMGKDERFHRTLKAELLSAPPFTDYDAAARALETWRHVYNNERPHEAIGMAVPAERYRASPRAFAEKVEPFDPAPGDMLRKVQQGGRFMYQRRRCSIPKAFAGRQVALRPTARDGVFEVFYRHQFIAVLDLTVENGDASAVHYVSEQVSTMSPV